MLDINAIGLIQNRTTIADANDSSHQHNEEGDSEEIVHVMGSPGGKKGGKKAKKGGESGDGSRKKKKTGGKGKSRGNDEDDEELDGEVANQHVS